jgi:hypothetical protein
MHQLFFNVSIPTLLKAINNNQLINIPFMKSNLIKKYLAKSPATGKGRMKRPRAGICSTHQQTQQPTAPQPSVPESGTIHPNAIQTTAHLSPTNDHEHVNNVFCYAALADKQKGTLYTDATGALPARSLNGNQYYLVAYDYDTNYILPIPINSQSDNTIIDAFVKVFDQLKSKGF